MQIIPDFQELIESAGLLQQVKAPTYNSGNILELVLSRNNTDIEPSVPYSDYFISDHSTGMLKLQDLTSL